MFVTRRIYTETIEYPTTRIRNVVTRWYIIGLPVLTYRDEVWRKGASIDEALRRQIYERDHYECVYCGFQGQALTIDHRIPQIEGGETIESNLLTACKPCNSSKNGRTPEDAMMPLLYGRFRHELQEDGDQIVITIMPKGVRLIRRVTRFAHTIDRIFAVLMPLACALMIVLGAYLVYAHLMIGALSSAAINCLEILIVVLVVVIDHKERKKRRWPSVA